MNDENIMAGRGVPGRVQISTSRRCGVFFFKASLTKNQIEEVKGKTGVKYVVPNQPLYMDEYPEDSTDSDPDTEKLSVLAAPGSWFKSRFKKRDQTVADREAYSDLRYISTPGLSPWDPPVDPSVDPPLSKAYVYREEAGEGITIFAIDVAADIEHDEFRTTTGTSSLFQPRMYGMGSESVPDRDQGRVTCRLSKMVGRTCGVARKAKVIVAKITTLVASLLDVFMQIDNLLVDKFVGGEDVRGKYVMSFRAEWDDVDWRTGGELDWVLLLLVKGWQVTVVVPAGDDPRKRNSDIDLQLKMSAGRLDFLVVGAVNINTGKLYGFSKGGDWLTVSAPGFVKCADGSGYKKHSGTDLAAAQVLGVVAYTLSLPDVAGNLQATNRYTLAMGMERFIIQSAKTTKAGLRAIWNQCSDDTSN